MNYDFYYPKTAEEEVRQWMDFLKCERGIQNFPNISTGDTQIIAWHDGQIVHFRRIGLSVGQLIIEKFDSKKRTSEFHPLYPYVRYWDGEPEDKLILDEETKDALREEQEELEKKFRLPVVQEGIVPLV